MRNSPKFLKSRPTKTKRVFLWNFFNYALPIIVAYAGVQASTQIFARLTRLSEKINGKPVLSILGKKVFSPVIYLGNVVRYMFSWNLTHEHDRYAEIVNRTTYPAIVCSLFAVALVFLISTIRRFQNNLGNLHGTAGWSTPEDLMKAGLMSNGGDTKGLSAASGVICGQLARAKVTANKENKSIRLEMREGGEAPLICHEGKANTLLMAQTGHGKGVGVIIPTLLSYRSSMVIYDPKGENFSLTAGFRREFSRVVKFAPLDMDSAGYNPVMAIKDDIHAFAEADFISSVFFPAGDEGSKDNSDFFNQSAKDILTTLLLHLRFSDRPERDKSLAGAYRALSTVDADKAAEGGEDNNALKELFNSMLKEEHFLLDEDGNKDTSSDAARATLEAIDLGLRRQIQANPKELASCVKTVFSKMQLFQDPAIARATTRTDFDIEDFVTSDDPISLYLVVPYSDIKRIAPVFRLFINLMLHRFSSGTTQFGETKLKNHLLMLLDEFPTLGKFPTIEENMGVLRGYGVNFLIVVQGLNQIRSIYGDKHSFLTHCVTKIIYSPGDEGDAEIFSKMMGKESIEYTKVGQSGSGPSMSGVNVSTQDIGRELMSPDELMRMGGEWALVMESGEQPYLAKKVVYYLDARFKPRLDWAKSHPVQSRAQKIKAIKEKLKKKLNGKALADAIAEAESDKSIRDDLMDECWHLPSQRARREAERLRKEREAAKEANVKIWRPDDPLDDNPFDDGDDWFDEADQQKMSAEWMDSDEALADAADKFSADGLAAGL